MAQRCDVDVVGGAASGSRGRVAFGRVALGRGVLRGGVGSGVARRLRFGSGVRICAELVASCRDSGTRGSGGGTASASNSQLGTVPWPVFPVKRDGGEAQGRSFVGRVYAGADTSGSDDGRMVCAEGQGTPRYAYQVPGLERILPETATWGRGPGELRGNVGRSTRGARRRTGDDLGARCVPMLRLGLNGGTGWLNWSDICADICCSSAFAT